MRPSRFWTLLSCLCLVAVAGFPRAVGASPTPSPYDDRLDRDLAHAAEYGGEVIVPDGRNVLLRPHVDNGISIRAADEGSVIAAPVPLSAPAITLRGNGTDNVRPHLSGFRLVGPGHLARGQKTAGCDGIRIECQASLDHVRVEDFDSGLNVASVGGHVFCHDCTFTACYYNAFFSVGGGNYLFDSCYLDGAGMAGIGMPYDQGVEGMRVVSSHLGFEPYCVFQEPTPAGKTPSRIFLCDCEFDQAWFEQVGQCAIKSCWAGADGGPRCEFRDVSLRDVGYTAGPAFALPGAPAESAAVIGDYMSDGFSYDPGSHPFGAGASGKVFGFQRYNGVSGNAMQVAPTIRVNGATPGAMP